VEWKPVASTPEASQLLATRQWSNLEIALMFGVPPHMVQAQQSGQSMTYSNIETEAIDFVKFGLLYWLTQIEESMPTRLPGVQYCRFNLDALMRTDTLNRAKSYEIFANMGALTTTEIRGLEGRPPLEEIRQPPGVGRVQEPPQGAGLEVLGGGQGG
jgi:HK97 family phage portal protein